MIYAIYLGIVAECVIIGIDRWRHDFRVLGVLGSLTAPLRAYLAEPQAAA